MAISAPTSTTRSRLCAWPEVPPRDSLVVVERPRGRPAADFDAGGPRFECERRGSPRGEHHHDPRLRARTGHAHPPAVVAGLVVSRHRGLDDTSDSLTDRSALA